MMGTTPGHTDNQGSQKASVRYAMMVGRVAKELLDATITRVFVLRDQASERDGKMSSNPKLKRPGDSSMGNAAGGRSSCQVFAIDSNVYDKKMVPNQWNQLTRGRGVVWRVMKEMDKKEATLAEDMGAFFDPTVDIPRSQPLPSSLPSSLLQSWWSWLSL